VDSLRFVKLPSAEEPDPLATARSRRGEGSNTYRQHEQLTAREREPLRSVEAYEKEAAENAGGEEIRTPRGTRIRSGSVKGRAAFFQDLSERSPSPAWLKEQSGNSRDPSPTRFVARRAETNEFGAVFR